MIGFFVAGVSANNPQAWFILLTVSLLIGLSMFFIVLPL